MASWTGFVHFLASRVLREATGLALALTFTAALHAQENTLFLGGTVPGDRAVVADLNGDGLDDLVTRSADPFEPATNIAFGRPDGTYSPALQLPLFGSPPGVGDVNGDGHLDVVASFSGKGILTMLGNGDGSFAPAIESPVVPGQVLGGFALADFNHDGSLDLLVDRGSGPAACGCVALALGHGDGSFEQPVEVPLGGDSIFDVAADFDGDGNTDVLAGISAGGPDRLVFLPGDGHGGFGAKVETIPPVEFLGEGVAARLDADDLLDLVVGSSTPSAASAVTILRNAGAGAFAIVDTITLFPASEPGIAAPASPAIADADGDGVLDVVATANSHDPLAPSGLWFLRGHGDLSLDPPIFTAIHTGGALRATDIDHDGRLDFIAGVAAVYGRGDGTFRVPEEADVGAAPMDLAAADLNADRHPDLVIAVHGSGDQAELLRVLLGAGDGTFTPGMDVSALPATLDFKLGDVDGDSIIDIVAALASTPDSISVVRGLGDGTFAPLRKLEAGSPQRIALADVDGDGSLDILTVDAQPLVGVLLNHGDGHFDDLASYALPGVAGAVAVADLNEDGTPDLALTVAGSSSVAVLLGSGGGTFGSAVLVPAKKEPRGLVAIDSDHDGHVDLLTTNYKLVSGEPKQPTSTFLHGHGDGTFGSPLVGDYVLSDGFAVGDLNADGLADVVPLPFTPKPTGDATLLVSFGRPDGQHDASVFFTGGAPQGVALADFDGNGFPDMAVAQSLEHEVTLYLNQSKTWATLGHGLMASFGTPLLSGHGVPLPDLPVSLTATDLPRGAAGLLFVGFSAQFTPLLGGALVPAPDLALAITADAPLTDRWPKGLPPGTPVYFQAWFAGAAAGLPAGQAAATNALVTLSR